MRVRMKTVSDWARVLVGWAVEARRMIYVGVVMEKRRIYKAAASQEVSIIGREAGYAYTLDSRNEGDVEEEPQNWVHLGFDNIPTVVFTTNLIASSTPVVEGESELHQVRRGCL